MLTFRGLFARTSGKPVRQPRSRSLRTCLRLDELEPRLAPAYVDISVTTLSGTGPGSIWNAIQQANGLQDGDFGRISFAPGLHGTVHLTTPLPMMLKVERITGPGADQLAIIHDPPENAPFRIFNIYCPQGEQVQIVGLSIAGGVAKGTELIEDRGGGISASGPGELKLSNCVVSRNWASGEGGGIYCSAEKLTLEGCTIVGNISRSNGGGINARYGLVVTNSVVKDNTAGGIGYDPDHDQDAGYGDGGGIYVFDARGFVQAFGDTTVSKVEILQSEISNNTAYRNGGGLCFFHRTDKPTRYGTETFLETSTVAGNRALTGAGGGVWTNLGAQPLTPRRTIRESTIDGNTAARGGLGVHIDDFERKKVSDPTILSSTITDNKRVASQYPPSERGNLITPTDWAGIFAMPAVADSPFASSVFVGNVVAAGNDKSDANDKVFSQGGCFIGKYIGVNTGNWGGGDQVGTAANPLDPKLNPLRNYGGPTRTRLPKPDSPLIDAGDPTRLPRVDTDQRGLTRKVGPKIDIGAVEVQPQKTPTGRLWDDRDQDGIQDATELGLEGVTIRLLDAGNQIVATTTTDANGLYRFDPIDPGTYSIQVVVPTDRQLSPEDQGSDDDADSDFDPTTSRGPTFSDTDSSDPVFDGGLYGSAVAPATVGDRVWLNLNENGLQDSGEPGLAGVSVELSRIDGTGVQFTTTDSSGAYQFSAAPGDYRVSWLAPVGYGLVEADQGTDDDADSDALGLPGGSFGMSAVFTLHAGDTVVNLDAGFRSTTPGFVGDRVWYDRNGNGLQDPGEWGLAGAEVRLLDDTGEVVAITYSGGDGAYGFSEVSPGTYRLQFIPPQSFNLVFSPQHAGTEPWLDSDAASDGRTDLFTVSAGQGIDSLDAGLRLALPSTQTLAGAADLTGDGVVDLVVVTKDFWGTRVTAFDGATGATVFTVTPFGNGYSGDLYIALGDLTDDGVPDLVIGNATGSPAVRMYNGSNGTLFGVVSITSDPFADGVRVGLWDLEGDGDLELVTGTGNVGSLSMRGWQVEPNQTSVELMGVDLSPLQDLIVA